MSIYQHFRKEEKKFVDQVLEWCMQVENNYSPKLTDFMDQRELHIIQSIIGSSEDVKWTAYGGTENAERKRVLLHPAYFEPSEEDYLLKLFELKYPKKFLTIEHPQILGTMMSIGINREKFGDILIKDEVIQFFVVEEMSSYIQTELKQIGKATVKLLPIPISSAINSTDEWVEAAITVSSMRLDVIISTTHNISRAKGQALIQGDQVKVNWQAISQIAFECDINDVISIRGYGRCKIMEISGKTKKEKWRIVIGKLI